MRSGETESPAPWAACTAARQPERAECLPNGCLAKWLPGLLIVVSQACRCQPAQPRLGPEPMTSLLTASGNNWRAATAACEPRRCPTVAQCWPPRPRAAPAQALLPAMCCRCSACGQARPGPPSDPPPPPLPSPPPTHFYRVQPMEIYVDDEAKLTLHGLVQHYVVSSRRGRASLGRAYFGTAAGGLCAVL